MGTDNKWVRWLLVIIAVVSINSLIGIVAYDKGYNGGLELGRLEQRVISNLNLRRTLEDYGYILKYEEKEYNLKYIRGEGWFIIDHNRQPYPLMYRLNNWLEEKEPIGR